MILTIDGVEYDVKCRVRRSGDVRDTDISGEMLDGSYFHDVEGTYYDYELTFLYPLYDRSKYAAIYEVLTQPVDGHSFVLPYNNSTISLTAKVDLTDDELLELENGTQYWQALRFALTSNAPSKEMSLSEVITRGMTPFPEISSPQIGATYTYTVNGWQAVQDVDDTAF